MRYVKLKKVFVDGLGLLGAALLFFGVYQINSSLGFIVGGAELMALAYLAGKNV